MEKIKAVIQGWRLKEKDTSYLNRGSERDG